MPPLLLVTCAIAVVLTGCARESAPADPAPIPPQAPAATSPNQAQETAAPTEFLPPANPASGPLKLALSGEGLSFASEQGSVRHLPFDTPSSMAVDAVSRARGGAAPQLERNDECGAGPLDMAIWQDGLTVLSQEGRFVGWSVSTRAGDGSGAGPATIAGIGVGSTRRELEGAYSADIRETTLGQEFAAGDVYGVLDGTGPAARITAMWAGASCNFR